MRHWLAIAIAVIGSFVCAQAAHAGACAPTGWQAQVLTPSDHKIAKNGAIVVGVIAGGVTPPSGDANPAVHPWKLSNDTKTIELEVSSVAPGVATYRPKKPFKGSWKVVKADGTETGSGVELSGADAKPLAAPSLSAAVFRRTTHDGPDLPERERGRTSESFSISLGEAAPEQALGLVLFVSTGDKSQPALFSRVGTATGTQLPMWSTPGRCAPRMAGQTVPVQGDRVAAAWIDRNGLLSEHSAAVTVTSAPAPVAITQQAKAKDTGSSAQSGGGSGEKEKSGCSVSGRPGTAATLVVIIGLAALRRRFALLRAR